MSYLEKTFTPEIKLLRDLQQDLRQRLSSMLSSTEQETQRLEASSEELQETAISLGGAFYETHLLLKLYETELDRRLGRVISSDSMEENSGSVSISDSKANRSGDLYNGSYTTPDVP